MLPVILIVIACVLAGVATVFVGFAPVEENYGKQTRRRLLRLTCIYGAATLLFLAVFWTFQT